jgi:hypothetical protein
MTNADRNPDVFRHQGLERFTSLICALLLVILALGALASGVGIWAGGQPAESLILMSLTLFIAPLALYVWNDSVAKFGWQVTIAPDHLALILPATRSYLSRPPAFAGDIALADIAALEWREEDYRAGPMSVTVKVWSLRLKDGTRIMLGEDRPIPRTGMHTDLMQRTGNAIARATGLKPRRLPAATGSAGLLGLAFTRAPDWPAPNT